MKFILSSLIITRNECISKGSIDLEQRVPACLFAFKPITNKSINGKTICYTGDRHTSTVL